MLASSARTMLLTASLGGRQPVPQRAFSKMATTDFPAFVTTMWSDMTAAGQSKDAGKIDAVFNDYFADTCSIIRPSGNPLDLSAFKGMLGSPDIIVEEDAVISVDDVKEIAGGNAAVVVYTTHSKFSYKGTPNDDIAKFSATLEKTGDKWKVAHLHRGTGQPPAA